MQLQDVHDTNRYLMLKRLTSTTVKSVTWHWLQSRRGSQLFDFRPRHLRIPVCHRHATRQAPRNQQQLFTSMVSRILLKSALSYVSRINSQVFFRGMLFQHLLNLPAQTFSSPAEVGLKDLSNVHTGRNTQGVQHNFNGRPSSIYGISSSGRIRKRHPCYRDDQPFCHQPGAYAGGNIDLDHLDYTRRQIVAPSQLLNLIVEYPTNKLNCSLSLDRTSATFSSTSVPSLTEMVAQRSMVRDSSSSSVIFLPLARTVTP